MASFFLRVTTPNDGLILLRTLLRNDADSHFIVVRQGSKFFHIPVSTVEEAKAVAERWSALGADVYLACAGFASGENRKACNATGAWALWSDVDVGAAKADRGAGYATLEEADAAWTAFCPTVGIPYPTHVLGSGTGRQIFWALTERLEREAWQSTANKLKALAHVLKFRADPSRTADIASVMRLPGTLNRKYDPPRPVKLIKASREFIETATFCRQIEEAHSKYCSAPVAVPTRTPVDRDQRQYGPPDMDRLRTALSYLDPDCAEEKWRFYLAAMARAAREYPDLAEALGNLAIEWSRGDLWHKPSEKWRESGRQRNDR